MAFYVLFVQTFLSDDDGWSLWAHIKNFWVIVCYTVNNPGYKSKLVLEFLNIHVGIDIKIGQNCNRHNTVSICRDVYSVSISIARTFMVKGRILVRPKITFLIILEQLYFFILLWQRCIQDTISLIWLKNYSDDDRLCDTAYVKFKVLYTEYKSDLFNNNNLFYRCVLAS